MSLSRGKHQIKLGFDVMNSSSGGYGQEFGAGYTDGRFQINPLYKTIPIATVLTLNPSLPPPGAQAGAPPLVSSFTQSFGNQNYHLIDTLFGLFAQDNWNILPNLNVNLGIRWDGETFTGQNALFSPRAGFAWGIPGSNTVIRGGYGIYYWKNVPICMPVQHWVDLREPSPIPRFLEVLVFRQRSHPSPSRQERPCRPATSPSSPDSATI